ncbi:hypothetical protein C2134_12555 [Chromobacterium sinusclupearum]|uniref:Uncharacterized protein n=1 Tax=Chromobacterium sinusclupearum TaxID=2077146 RepID=A0A2K4MMI4_9NEIS|nr:hypothetical protein [Chromobacterium sinusclupearum]POA98273.1 hypothetical protein C2134_12555 [Chromobacterium sinusclupearum]
MLRVLPFVVYGLAMAVILFLLSQWIEAAKDPGECNQPGTQASGFRLACIKQQAEQARGD